MTPKEIITSDSDEYLRFENVKGAKASRPDLHAFIILSVLHEGTHDVVSGTNHDEIFLSFNPDTVFAKATTEQAMDLVRCGVRFDSSHNAFCMFV